MSLIRLARLFWLLLLIASAICLSLLLRLESDILKLLPKYQSPLTAAVAEQAAQQLNRQLVVAARGADEAALTDLFEQQMQQFQQSDYFSEVRYQIDFEQMAQVYRDLEPIKFNLLAAEDKKQLSRTHRADYFVDLANQQLYGLGSVSVAGLQTDPLFFLQRLMTSLSALSEVKFTPHGSYFSVKQDGRLYLFAFLSLKQANFVPQFQRQVEQLLQLAEADFNAQGMRFIAFGAMRYAAWGYAQAETEISTVGVGSLFAIVLLFWLVFRRLQPLLLSVAAIAAGLLPALAVCLLLFGKIHIFALVFGATIAGVSIDYCFHYLIAATVNRHHFSLKSIIPPLLLGFASSAVVYLGFVVSGYEVLVQIATFSVLALFSVLLNVLLFLPLFYRPKALPSGVFLNRLVAMLLYNPLAMLFSRVWLTVSCLLLLLGGCWLYLPADDDVRALQAMPEALKQQEQTIRDLLSLNNEAYYLLLNHDKIDGLLAAEAKILNQLRAAGETVFGISDWLPERQQRLENVDFYQQLFADSAVQSYLTQLNLTDYQVNPAVIDEQQLLQLTQKDWFKTLFRQRWLGQVQGHYALLIPLPKKPAIALNNGVKIINQADDASQLFADFRRQIISLMIPVVGVLLILLAIFRYGWKRAVHLLSLPLLAGVSALLLTHLLGLHISLFSVLAVLLILGMGIDYVVFLTENHDKQAMERSDPPTRLVGEANQRGGRLIRCCLVKPVFIPSMKEGRQDASMTAVLLSATTTILAFGLLALSEVAVIKSFGTTVGSGILLLLLLAPAVAKGGSYRLK